MDRRSHPELVLAQMLDALNTQPNIQPCLRPAASPGLQAKTICVVHNSLSGPLFPAAWLQRGSLPHLDYLSLSSNPGLAGTLPPSLPWANLTNL